MIPEIVCIGDNVVDVYVDEGIMFPGGNAVNVAVNVTRIGGRATYIGALGTDHAGEVILNSLHEEGVDTTRTRILPGTNAYAIVRLVGGDRHFAPGSVGVSRFVPDAGDLALLASTPVTHTGECSMLEDHVPTLGRAATFLSYDFSERPWDYVEALAPHVDLAILSCPRSSSDEPADVASRVLALGPSQVIVSTGADGALWTDGSAKVHAAAPEREVVDTLGAGDALIGRILVGLSRRETPDVFMPAATAYATASCMERGAFGHATTVGSTTSSPKCSERQE
ncbi:MAG: PfkB family carbohydrate kinase [Nocardioides sp.]|uniref:PfkB family carbohydrate kinase n=1 Tax=Nocardioides sp. TaxID=35761 RepID=UPI0039E33775